MANSHSIWSTKPLLVIDGDTHASINSFTRGDVIISWTDNTRYGFQEAIVVASTGGVYQFTLVAVSSSNDDYIEGLWDIRRNGALVVRGGVGKLYGINQPVGQYFKLYIGTSQCYAEKWHLGAYITSRLDF